MYIPERIEIIIRDGPPATIGWEFQRGTERYGSYISVEEKSISVLLEGIPLLVYQACCTMELLSETNSTSPPFRGRIRKADARKNRPITGRWEL